MVFAEFVRSQKAARQQQHQHLLHCTPAIYAQGNET